MRKSLWLIGAATAISLATTSLALCGPTAGYGAATVDGNLSDWTGVTWNSFDTTYDSSPTDVTDGAWAAKWTADKIYMAVKVKDTAHVFKDSYTGWAARDAIEIYTHVNGTGSTDYSQYQESAQEWTVGLKTTADGAVWKTVGDPISYGNYTVSNSEMNVAGSVSGDWLYYEAAITPYQYFAGRRALYDSANLAHPSSVTSTLSKNQVIGLDCTAVTNDGVSSSYGIAGYAGMKCSTLNQSVIGSWAADYSRFAQVTLIPEPSTVAIVVTGALSLLAYAWRKRR
jgi:hypothetical protein